ncbi:MAG: MaoC family dehydratase [Promethearchaeota archaeon]
MTRLKLSTPTKFKDFIGKEIGYSDYIEVTQEKINLFADATGDHQWIHVDVERAKRESPYGGPIAHGYYTLSIIPELLNKVIEVDGVKLSINYGLNKVRFPAPVPVGSKVRAKFSIANVKDLDQGNIEVEFLAHVEVENAKKPSCVASVIYRYYV